MAATEVDCGVLTEIKIIGGIYTRFSLGYNVFASNANSVQQGGIAFFWRDNDLKDIKEMKIRGPNVLSFELVMGTTRFFMLWELVSHPWIPALRYHMLNKPERVPCGVQAHSPGHSQQQRTHLPG
jgi:hypothetical protein